MAGKRKTEHAKDQAVPAQLAGRIRTPGDDKTVTLSGRCGQCGYLLSAPGHENTCGTTA